MVEATTINPSSIIVQDKNPEKSVGNLKKTQGKQRTKDDVEWTNYTDEEEDSYSEEEWAVENPGKESPSTWDPQQFDQQTNSVDTWKGQDGPRRVQDIPSPTLTELPPEQRKLPSDEEEWPFKDPCAFEEKNKNKRALKSHQGVPSGTNSSIETSNKVGKVKKELSHSDKFSSGIANGDGSKPPVGPTRKLSKDLEDADEDDDINDDAEDSDRVQAWKMRESWKSSSHSKSSASDTSEAHGSRSSKRGRKAEVGAPVKSVSRPDADKAAADEAPLRQKSREDPSSIDDKQPAKPTRKVSRRGSSVSSDAMENSGENELGLGSFHGLKKDADKKTTRTSSRGRRTPTGGRSRTARNKTPTGGRPTRRRVKEQVLDVSGDVQDGEDLDGSEDGDFERVKLKGDDSGTPGSRGSRERRKQRQRANSDEGGTLYEAELNFIDDAPRSAGRRIPSLRRTQIRRSHSERWMSKVEAGEEDAEAIQFRAQEALKRANNELSQSAHNMRRYSSASLGGLDHRSYHGADYGRRSQPDLRRTPRRPIRQYESVDSAGSFGGDSYDSYDEASVYSQRTLESIEDFEDFTGIDFQTPGMIDFDEEVLELMQRANPETTAHLDRRVHRKREQVMYDQNMPMMTRQALLTRQASAQVTRQVVDGSNIDRRRLLLKTDSMHSVDSHDELTLSNHRSLRGPGARRAPPRSRSSGLGAMVPGGGGPRGADTEPRRGVYRTRSSTQTSSFKQYYNKPNRVQSLTRRPSSSDQIEPHSMRGPSSSGDPLARRGALQRAKSTTALRRSGSDDRVSPQKQIRRALKKQDDFEDDINEFSEDSDVVSEDENLTPSPRKPMRRAVLPGRKAPARAKSDILPRKKPVRVKSTDKKDMSNKRNRCKLHLLMYEAKMGIEMKDLFQKVREGDAPKSPSKTLMMPSP